MAGAFVAMQDGIVDFRRYPLSAVNEVAARQAIYAVDQTIAISKIRDRLLRLDGLALKVLLRDLQQAAERHGIDDVVELADTD
jgi:aspartyl/asparaginyl beta-hydroxylase (cupin superfamily)